jgi:hypothetical protein
MDLKIGLDRSKKQKRRKESAKFLSSFHGKLYYTERAKKILQRNPMKLLHYKGNNLKKKMNEKLGIKSRSSILIPDKMLKIMKRNWLPTMIRLKRLVRSSHLKGSRFLPKGQLIRMNQLPMKKNRLLTKILQLKPAFNLPEVSVRLKRLVFNPDDSTMSTKKKSKVMYCGDFIGGSSPPEKRRRMTWSTAKAGSLSSGKDSNDKVTRYFARKKWD